jgi:integrase
MKVHLKSRPLSKGKSSLYLEISHKGKRHIEFLKLHVLDNPKTLKEKQLNKDIEMYAEKKRSERFLELQNNNNDFIPQSQKQIDFLKYFKNLTEERKSSKGNYDNWDSCYKHIVKFSPITTPTFADIDEAYVSQFKDYLIKTVSTNSASSYFNKFKAALKMAFESKIINDNPAKRIRGIKQADTQREFLAEEELQSLINTECEFPMLKKAFIFSCFTGLRWSDCVQLKWSNFQHSEKDGWRIVFRQVKTKGQEYLPITGQTIEFLGAVGSPEDKVFAGLFYSAWHNLKLSQWVMKAGITKKITFHCARHTHATLLLSNNTDIYMVMNILGHKSVRTTQIYAKVLDTKKAQAVNNIPNFILSSTK